MNEASLLVVIGLGLDILGALMILGPIRQRRRLGKRIYKTLKEITDSLDKREKGEDEISPLSNKEKIDELFSNDYDRQISELEDYPKLLTGVGLLVFGFILQIIGNWILNPPV